MFKEDKFGNIMELNETDKIEFKRIKKALEVLNSCSIQNVVYEGIIDLIPTKEECDNLNKFQKENLKKKRDNKK